MKKILALIFFATAINAHITAQPYGRHYYPGSSVIYSGYHTESPGNEGFIMAGIDGQLIHIDKTSIGGTMPFPAGPTSFQQDYSLSSGGMSCMGSLSGLITPQGGVCAIEAAGPSYQYLLAANFPEGVSVTYIDGSGAAVNTVAFSFLSPAVTLARPTIVQSPTGEIYVCGTYNNDLYVVKIKPSGLLDWSFVYSITGSNNTAWPHDMIISNTTGEVVIVGNLQPGAFFLKLSPNTGSINTFTTYGPNGDCFFHTIRNTANGNYVVGGHYLGPNNIPMGNAIMASLNQAGGIIWSTRLISGAPNQFSKAAVVGVAERINPNTTQPEYYGVTETTDCCCTTFGVSVFKLDAWGNPVTGNNEFHYPASTAGAVIGLSINDFFPATDDVGFHIYGRGTAFSVSGHLLQESYFNGVTFSGTTCQEILTTCNFAQGPGPMTHQLIRSGGLIQCNNVTTTNNTSGNISSICLSLLSVPGGSNLKPTLVQEHTGNAKAINIYPNPGTGIYTIKLDYDAQLVVSDMLGKTILETSLVPGNNSINLLSYPAGIYHAKISGNAKTETMQLVKE